MQKNNKVITYGISYNNLMVENIMKALILIELICILGFFLILSIVFGFFLLKRSKRNYDVSIEKNNEKKLEVYNKKSLL